MITTSISRSAPRNHGCPMCRGHVWWSDEVQLVTSRRIGKRHWWNTKGPCHDGCVEGAHVHRTDRCMDCGWTQTASEAPVGEDTNG